MAQGKMKVKGKVPNQKQTSKQNSKQKGKAFTRRPNAPIQAKKQKFAEAQKLKQLVSKNVNKSMEAELRTRAKEGQINLSKAQQAVAKYHKEKEQAPSASASVTSG